MKTRIALVAGFLGLATSLSSAVQLAEAKSTVATTASDSQQIVLVMKKQFDRPDVPLSVNPVSIVGSYALAGWIQGKKGGRALLQKEQGQWRISVCGGDGLTQAKVLETTGMSMPVATQLAQAAVAAEARLSAGQRRQFSSFEGMVKVDAHHGEHK
jgi:hypothetical protein